MKFSFKTSCSLNLFFLLFISLGSFSAKGGAFALISGTPLDWQKEVTRSFLEKHLLNQEGLVQWDEENERCLKRENVYLQLCFYQGNVYLVQMDQQKIKQTLGRLMMMDELEANAQKPSIGGLN